MNGKSYFVRVDGNWMEISRQEAAALRLEGHDIHPAQGDFTMVNHYLSDFWCPVLGPGVYTILTQLLRHCYGTKNHVWPSVQRIADLCGYRSLRPVRKALEILESYGFIREIRVMDAAKKQHFQPIFVVRRTLPILPVNEYRSLPIWLRQKHDEYIAKMLRANAVALEDIPDYGVDFTKYIPFQQERELNLLDKPAVNRPELSATLGTKSTQGSPAPRPEGPQGGEILSGGWAQKVPTPLGTKSTPNKTKENKTNLSKSLSLSHTHSALKRSEDPKGGNPVCVIGEELEKKGILATKRTVAYWKSLAGVQEILEAIRLAATAGIRNPGAYITAILQRGLVKGINRTENEVLEAGHIPGNTNGERLGGGAKEGQNGQEQGIGAGTNENPWVSRIASGQASNSKYAAFYELMRQSEQVRQRSDSL